MGFPPTFSDSLVVATVWILAARQGYSSRNLQIFVFPQDGIRTSTRTPRQSKASSPSITALLLRYATLRYH